MVIFLLILSSKEFAGFYGTGASFPGEVSPAVFCLLIGLERSKSTGVETSYSSVFLMIGEIIYRFCINGDFGLN